MRTLMAFSMACILVLSVGAQNAPAPHSIAELQARWDRYRPSLTDWQVMETRADYNTPFVLGKLAAAYARDALGMLNFIRFLAGLPDDLEIDADLAYRAQALTAITSMNGVNSHTPGKPKGIPEEVFAAGYEAGRKSNLHMSLSEGGDPERIRSDLVERWGPYPALGLARRHFLAMTMLLYVGDADYRNIFKAEHRRNLFRHQTKKVGFGYVDFYTERMETDKELFERRADPSRFQEEGPWYRYKLEQYSSAHVLDSSRSQPAAFDYLAWPSSGYFPAEFWARLGPAQPWSVTLNPTKYKVDDPARLTVAITGPNGYQIRIGAKDRPESWDAIGDDDMEEGDNLKKFLRFQPATTSWLPTILFFPGEARWPEAKAGDRYRVVLGGIKDAAGKPVELTYWVEFFHLAGSDWLGNIFSED